MWHNKFHLAILAGILSQIAQADYYLIFSTMPSPDEWYALVKQWRDSSDNQKTFCEKNNLVPKTFSRWVSNYREMFELDFNEDETSAASVATPPLPSSTPYTTDGNEGVTFVELGTVWLTVKVPLTATESQWMKILTCLRECR